MSKSSTRHLFIMGLVALSAMPSLAQPNLDSKLKAIEQAVDDKRKELNIAGASLVIVKDDKVIYLQGLGQRDVEQGLPVTPDTLFAIGSSSKAFTASLVMMAQEQGKLNLTDSPKKLLPFFKMKDAEADSKMTIRDLLCHRSGLQRTDMLWAMGKLNRNELVAALADVTPTAKYGQAWQYQNIMFLAAGQVVAAAQHRSWDEALRQSMLLPLGMGRTNTTIQKMMASNDFAKGYAWDGQAKQFTRVPMRDIANCAPAGAINSSAREMAQWLRVMLGKGQVDSKRLFTEASWEELTKSHMPMGGGVNYGLGWFLRQWNGHKVVEHGGNIDGFNAQVALMPDQNLGFCLLTNISASSLGSDTMKIVWENLVGGQPAQSAAPIPAAGGPLVPAELEAGDYLIKAANVTMSVKVANNQLSFVAPGQPPYPLTRVSGRRYKFGQPAPDGFFVTFRANAADSSKQEAYLEQPQGNVVLEKTVAIPFKAPISSDELMAKMVTAIGGEAAIRKHQSLRLEYSVMLENMGVGARGVRQQVAPNLYRDEQIFTALKRDMGSAKTVFDGKRGADIVSFGGYAPRVGPSLGVLPFQARLHADADWKEMYQKVEITGMGKVGDEETYAVKSTLKNGTVVNSQVSTKSFRTLKAELPGIGSSIYSDFRTVDGVLLPFREESVAPGKGKVITITKRVQWNIDIPKSRFRVPEDWRPRSSGRWLDEPWLGE